MKSVSLTLAALAMLSSAEANCVVLPGVYDTNQCNGLNQAICANVGDECGWQAPVPTNCVPGTTFTDSACSAACDGGTLTTTRSGDVQPTNGGDACASTTTTGVACNSQACAAIANCATQVTDQCSACDPGFSLASNACADIDDCASGPCDNGGTCTDKVNAYECACADGYSGATCAINIDECAGVDCGGASTCSDGVFEYNCACAAGWEGGGKDKVCTDVAECDANPCLHGTCSTPNHNSYSCACTTGYSGTNCDVDIDDCASGPCNNGGTCTDGVASYTCACATGWTGATCTDDVDECTLFGACGAGYDCANAATSGDPAVCTDHVDCTPTTCSYGGTCAEDGAGTGLYACTCAANYYGQHCDTHECPAGQYQDGFGTCTACPGDSISTSQGGVGLASCTPCDRCFGANGDNTACTVEHDIDCVPSDWSAWGSCSTTCAEGDASRTRAIVTDKCHDGIPCTLTKQHKTCLHAVCPCSLVICKYEAHSCTDYTAGEESILWGGSVNTANGNYHHTNQVASSYVRNVGMENVGTEVSFDETGAVNVEDTHDATLMCNSENSVRVYHDNGEPLSPAELVSAKSTGHHCRSSGGVCQCKCHSSFHHDYNPKVADRWDYTCGTGEDVNC